MKAKTKSKKVNKTWLNDHVNDTYVKLAQKEGYRARAAYKALVAAGAEVVLPMEGVPRRTSAFVTPAILDVTGIAVPDEEIFGDRKFNPKRLCKLARSKAYLFAGVEILWKCAPSLASEDVPAEATFKFPGGLADQFVADVLKQGAVVAHEALASKALRSANAAAAGSAAPVMAPPTLRTLPDVMPAAAAVMFPTMVTAPVMTPALQPQPASRSSRDLAGDDLAGSGERP